MKRIVYLLPVCFFVLLTNLSAQKSFFREMTAKDLPAAVDATKSVKKMKIFRIDEQGLRNYLQAAPLEFSKSGAPLRLEIPLPNGRTETFAIYESPILSPEVAAKYPEIKTYAGQSLTNPAATIRLSLTSSGFNAILLNVEGDAVYFQQYSTEARGIYFNYFTRDVEVPHARGGGSSCGVHQEHTDDFLHHRAPAETPTKSLTSQPVTLRTFRFAFAATGEFTANYGGTAMGGFNALVAYTNRINAVYRNELAVRLMLVSDASIVYVNAASDPYNQDDEGLMLEQNHDNLNAVLGNNNYDIGHVFGANPEFASSGGLASLGATCYDDIKGQGLTKEADPNIYSLLFNDQVVMHEIGHQFGMTHSYNSNISICTTRNLETSVEPGSGATIMSYGFTCDSEDYFQSTQTGLILTYHSINYSQAVAFLEMIDCAVTSATGNTSPTVTVPGNYTIPKSTPFALTGGGADINNDNLTYSWEGTNIGLENPVPDETTLDDPSKPPFFRTYEPTTSPTRIYPILDSILSGANQARGDKLPSIGIVTTHRLTVRDNNPAGGGVSFGQVSVTVNGNIGPFLVIDDLAPSYAGGAQINVDWEVNGTNVATPNVKISLSTDGGYTFPHVLAASTPNDGDQRVNLPNVSTTQARIKVEAVGNIFFDISNVNFTITAGPTVSCPTNQTVCAGTPAFVLTGATPGGGTYSGPGVAGGSFFSTLAGVGMHTITYTHPSGQCTFVITVTPSTTYYRDMDGDGFGNPAVSQQACSAPAGYVTTSTDCDDNDALEKPGQVWYKDSDNDGYSNGTTLTQCLRPAGYKVAAELTAPSGDCNDNNLSVNPGAAEICDGIDNNCNGQTDENGSTTYYRDMDGDGFGNPSVSQQACSVTVGYVANNTDCDDNDPLEKPGQVWYKDSDNDGYSTGTTLTQCLRPAGYKVAGELAATYGDCNDNNLLVNPGATEICDGIDNDCNGQTDEIDPETCEGWTDSGGIGCTDQASFNAGTFTLQTDGCTGGSPTSDKQGFIYYDLCGNGSLSFRVASVSSTNAFAGIALRTGLDPGAIKMELAINGYFTSRAAVRTTTDGEAWPRPSYLYGIAWLRLERVGNQVTIYSSSNGVNWLRMMVRTLSLPQCVYIGMMAYGPGMVTATFDNVVFTGSGNGNVAPPNQGAQLNGAPEIAATWKDFSVYPNPTSGWLTVNWPEDLDLATAQLEVVDQLGRLRLRLTDLEQTPSLDLSDLTPGLYYLRLQNAAGEHAVQRVVVQPRR